MANKILLQGVTPETHLIAVRHVLGIPEAKEIIFSVAFMNRAGLLQIRDALEPVAGITTIIAGIRNGITSAQGLLTALEVGCTVFVVDTGSRNVIFHPKIYLSYNVMSARLVLGSANLTIGGLRSNIEASVAMEIDLGGHDDAELVADIRAKISGMISEYPDHVFKVTDAGAVANLLEAGRVVDESIVMAPAPGGSSRNRDLDTISKMELKTRPPRRPRLAPVVPVAGPVLTAAVGAPVPAGPVGDVLTLVWESGELVRRDLSIPEGPNSSITASMLLKKGESDIDQQTYFRETVFRNLDWQPSPRTIGKELAKAKFNIVIKGIDYGEYTLTVENDTRKHTKSFIQRQPTAALRWGDAIDIIAREDLLGRKMCLYADSTKSDQFVIEID